MALILAYKYRSETMAICMTRVQNEIAHSNKNNTVSRSYEHENHVIPITYAGRLDPMASGLVVFLAGELRFKKESFLKFPKTYSISWFMDYKTDTHDMLGIAVKSNAKISEINLETIKQFQPVGIFTQKFPAFSSRKVFGKPLFHHAKNTDVNFEIPEQSHSVEISNYKNFSTRIESSKLIIESVIRDIQNVVGDFRQDECIDSWNSIINTMSRELNIYSVTMDVSTGFYVRQWVHDLGLKTGSSAVTFSINRDTIGLFTMSMLNGESYRIFDDNDPMVTNLTI